MATSDNDMKTNMKKIAIIGSGHMGTALLEGFVKSRIAKSRIAMSDGPKTNVRVAASADVIFLAVKPGVVNDVLSEIKQVSHGKLIVSLAAGVTIASMKKSTSAHVARMMPNIPVAVNEGAIGIFAGGLPASEKKALRALLDKLGIVIEVKKESDLDTLTLIAGCGPGIVAYLVATLAGEANKLGLTSFESEMLAFQTFKGTLAYMEKTKTPAETMMRSVATKGGVTEAILARLTKEGARKAFARAIGEGGSRLRKIKK